MELRNCAYLMTWQTRPWDRLAPTRHFEVLQLPGWSPELPGKIPFRPSDES